MSTELIKSYPLFTPNENPNRAQRRKDAGVNKRGLHKLKTGHNLLVIGQKKFDHFYQTIPLKDVLGNIIGFKRITHTK